MSGFKKALTLSALVLSAIVSAPGTPSAMASPTSGGDNVSSSTWHCC